MPPGSVRSCWPYLSTPIGVYLLIMLPICGSQVFLLLTNCPAWMRWSAGAVVALSLYGLLRGYGRRLVLTRESATLVGPIRRVRLDWPRVRLVGVYIPGGGLGATEYLYITTRDTPPAGKWDCGAETIQVQNRPGLLEALMECRGRP